jgi:hypothetical protein
MEYFRQAKLWEDQEQGVWHFVTQSLEASLMKQKRPLKERLDLDSFERALL